MLLIGRWFSRRQTSTEVYFVAKRSIPQWAMGVTIYATLITNAAEQSQFTEERQEFEFAVSPSDSPIELKAWFQGSGRLGREFIYEK